MVGFFWCGSERKCAGIGRRGSSSSPSALGRSRCEDRNSNASEVTRKYFILERENRGNVVVCEFERSQTRYCHKNNKIANTLLS